jgi:tetratricopeptide (TPR) repeat protein/predicted regulator of Ras-like GTPase activity (Roadblock/LC7/MglB family)
MHLIQRMKIWKELRRLEQKAREEPAPNTFVDLGQVYINLDMHDKAERIADDGLALFPKSSELRQLLECARRGLRKRRAEELRAKATRSPSAKTYQELAQVLVELGDTGALHTTCQEWNLRFPDDAGCWLVMGQARLVNFYRDLASREGVEAVRCLERAVQMQPDDPQSRRMLGELLYRIGAVRAAEKHLARLQQLDTADTEVAALLRHVQALSDHGDDVQALLDDVEANGSLRHASVVAAPLPTADQSMASVRDGLAHVASLPGVRKATFIRGSKALVKGAIRDGRDPFLRVARVVAKAAHRFARRLDIGSANKTIVEGPFGNICICVYGEVLAAAQCDVAADLPRVMTELQEIVAGALAVAED